MYPGELAAFLPPMTDRAGNLYVVTGQPDTTGSPQPGTAHTGGARGGWSAGCSTGNGTYGGARGWIGAVAGRGWLWTKTQIVEMDVGAANCTTKLDIDPSSMGDIIYRAVAPLLEETVSGKFAVAIINIGSDPTRYLVTLDLDLAAIRDSVALVDTQVLSTGADHETGEAAFLITDAAGTRLLLAKPNDGITAEIPVSGTVPEETAEVGEIAFGDDGSIIAEVRTDTVAVGTRDGLTITPAPLTARTVDRDDDGHAFLLGTDANGPAFAPVTDGQLGGELPWSNAIAVDGALANEVVVLDERAGNRTATKWKAHSAYGPSALLPRRSAPHYAVDTRAVLVADPPVDRGGIPYSQIAVVPVGVELE
jgi:hypothetical protein